MYTEKHSIIPKRPFNVIKKKALKTEAFCEEFNLHIEGIHDVYTELREKSIFTD
jgi:hypothetical protein